MCHSCFLSIQRQSFVLWNKDPLRGVAFKLQRQHSDKPSSKEDVKTRSGTWKKQNLVKLLEEFRPITWKRHCPAC